jgi:hypothetical protein
MSATVLRVLVGLDRPESEGSRPLAGYTSSETVLLLVAGVTFVGGLIHIGAAVDHFREFPLYSLAFVLIAALQLAWAATILRHPSRRVLLLGCVFTTAIIGLWVASRTIGVPIAPRPWVPEAVGLADLVETIGELVTVIAICSVVMAPRRHLARHVAGHLAPVLLAVLLLSVLYGVGAHAG